MFSVSVGVLSQLRRQGHAVRGRRLLAGPRHGRQRRAEEPNPFSPRHRQGFYFLKLFILCATITITLLVVTILSQVCWQG